MLKRPSDNKIVEVHFSEGPRTVKGLAKSCLSKA